MPDKTWHVQLHLPDELRIKATILAVKQNSTRTAVLRDLLTDAMADVEVPRELLPESDDQLIED